ncbi:DUF4199 domain-containing protein [Carboxylicivirga sediminis]|uniref:DUF4199 domain-containing protein n=1 Tax=Carboxylicivirga sediminis TaxID=2006564 RepID=A0A941IYL1_9BACT|nr:DUF4199 domain-containing protein [Carboxylicivirga sediminis]MBR8538006.1 DUF4199 domain-containing protein [Carboxylicivirga sediminis]
MKKIAIELKWGIIFFAAVLLWAVFEKSIGLHDERIDKHYFLTNFFAVPAIIIYVLALLDKRKWLGGKMTWSQGFLSGLIIAVIVSLLSPIGQYLTHEYLSPDYFANIIEYSVSEGKDREQMEAFFNLGSYIKKSMIGAVMMGAITSAIVAFFTKKS